MSKEFEILQARNICQTKIEQTANENSWVAPERENFKKLVLSDPNYFGIFPKFGGKAVKAFSGDTQYEQLECLGLNQGNNLEGVANVTP